VKTHESVAPYKDILTRFNYVYTGAIGDRRVYVGELKDKFVHIKKNVDLGPIEYHTFSGLYVLLFLLVDHYPYYRSPNFSIIKSFSTLVFPSKFFFPRVSTQKYWCL
jgi:hypothetical protein